MSKTDPIISCRDFGADGLFPISISDGTTTGKTKSKSAVVPGVVEKVRITMQDGSVSEFPVFKLREMQDQEEEEEQPNDAGDESTTDESEQDAGEEEENGAGDDEEEEEEEETEPKEKNGKKSLMIFPDIVVFHPIDPETPIKFDQEFRDGMIESFNEAGLMVPIDFNHGSEPSCFEKPTKEAGAAAGWITALIDKGTDGLWGEVKWLPKGKQAIKD